MTYLDKFYDAEAVYPPDWSEAAIAEFEIARLRRLAMIAQVCSKMKRRVDGGSRDLARDKRFARRIHHIASQQANAWNLELGPKYHEVSFDNQEIARLAATVNWPRYVQEHHDEVRERMRLIVSWAVDENKRRFGNRSANRLEVELERMQDAINR